MYIHRVGVRVGCGVNEGFLSTACGFGLNHFLETHTPGAGKNIVQQPPCAARLSRYARACGQRRIAARRATRWPGPGEQRPGGVLSCGLVAAAGTSCMRSADRVPRAT
eukprot:350989-Chlamydomonas_euryale.AAC.3